MGPKQITIRQRNGIVVKVAVIMGSQSDWEVMQHAVQILQELGSEYEIHIISAHRTPDRMFEFAEQADANGFGVIIAGAGGAAHLPGMTAAKTLIPVIGVPVPSQHLAGLDSLLSIVQMPGGVPVATVAIGRAGARNAGLMAAQILGLHDAVILERLREMRDRMRVEVEAGEVPK